MWTELAEPARVLDSNELAPSINPANIYFRKIKRFASSF